MDKIAFVIGETFLYWNSVILTLAALTAVLLFLSFYLRLDGSALAAETVIPLAMVLSLMFARFFHWYSRWDSYPDFFTAMTNYSVGGYALMGVFLGCFLAAVLVRLLKVENNLPRMLDAMSLAGAAGIAVGRLACFYSAADRGQIVQTITALPWVYPITNTVSGLEEYRLATFVIQALVTAMIFAGLMVWSFSRKQKDGDITLLFLLFYGASQVVLDSTRYDSLYFRSNGFVSIVQVMSAVALAAATAFFSVRWVRSRGWKFWYIGLWLAMAALMGGAGYMEYHVQRHGDQAVFAYSVMSTCLVLFLGLASWIYSCGLTLPKKTAAPKKVERDERWEEELFRQWRNEENSDELEFDFHETPAADSSGGLTFDFQETSAADSREEQTFDFGDGPKIEFPKELEFHFDNVELDF